MDRVSMQERFGIVGSSPSLRQALDRVRQVAGTEITVMIEGESGVGKELFAQALHEISPRRHKPMLTVNCGAIPEGLIESELFGNEKGAYTGAVERRSGYFEESNGSTLFLDEIGEMPLTAQVRLLRVLETGQFSRVGSSSVLKSDVRVLAATNKDLAREVATGRFREDLYYRLSTVIIRVPPLRERKEDIIPLFQTFQHRFSQKYNTPVRRLDDSARSLLSRYRWPGNVRELRNVAEQSVILLQGDTISADDIRSKLRGVTATGLMPVPHASAGDDTESRQRELIYRALLELRTEVRDLRADISRLARSEESDWMPQAPSDEDTSSFLIVRDEALQDPVSIPHEDLAIPAPVEEIEEVAFEIESNGGSSGRASGDGTMTIHDNEPFPTLEDAERTLITSALERFKGNRRQTANALGISERTLYRKLKEFEEEKD